MTPWLAVLVLGGVLLGALALAFWLLGRRAEQVGRAEVIREELDADRARLRAYAAARERIRVDYDRLRDATERDPTVLLRYARGEIRADALPGGPDAPQASGAEGTPRGAGDDERPPGARRVD